MAAIPLYPKKSRNAFTISLYLTMCIILSQGVLEVPLNTKANDPPFPESTLELPQGALVKDTTFELHIRDRVINNSRSSPVIHSRTPFFCFALLSI